MLYFVVGSDGQSRDSISPGLSLSPTPSMISVDEINQHVDNERVRSQRWSRGQQVYAASEGINQILNAPPRTAWSMPNLSRSSTRMETCSVGGQSSATVPLGVRMCNRARSATYAECASKVRSLPRQCCDVLGPYLCHECASINRRNKDTQKYEAVYPDLYTSVENFATTVLVKRHVPALSVYQIQHKLAKGEINRPILKECVNRVKEAKQKVEHETETKKELQRICDGKHPYTFFTSIRDLNEKIISGKASKNILMNIANQGKIKAKKKSKESFSERIMPMFVSPRKIKGDTSKFRAIYEPPLLPKVCQNVEPSFFAGSDKPYKLPDRLPDEVVQDASWGPCRLLSHFCVSSNER